MWAVLTIGALLTRPLLPAEAEILSAAWEQWMGIGDPAGPQAPPLLVGLIEASWSLFGVSAWPARLVAPGFGLAALLLIGPAARRLWPERPEVGSYAAFLVVGTAGVAVHLGVLGPAPPLLFFALLALFGLTLVWRGVPAGWIAFAVALALTALSSAAAALALLAAAGVLPPQLRAAAEERKAWYLGLGCSVLAAAVVDLAWLAAIDAPLRAWWAGPAFWTRTPGQMLAFAVLAVLALYPWLFWRTAWRSLRAERTAFGEPAARLCLAVLLAGLAAALLRGSVGHLLAAAPGFALLLARLLPGADRAPRDFHAVIPGFMVLFVGLVFFLLNMVPFAHLDAVWRELSAGGNLPIWLGGASLASGLILLGGGYVVAQMTPRHMLFALAQLAVLPLLLTTALNLEFALSLREFFDLRPVAEQVRSLQDQGRPVAAYAGAADRLSFPGRLRQPVADLGSLAAARDWATGHPGGVIVSTFHGGLLHLPAAPLHVGPVGNRWAALWPAETVLGTDGAVLSERFETSR